MITERLADRRFFFFSGKGGTGKTTCSSSFALHLAQQHRTLLVSTDRAHSLSDLFNVPIRSQATRLDDNLWAIEIDPEKEARKYIKSIKSAMQNVVSNVIINAIKKQMDAAYLSPGTEETAIFDKFIELMENINSPYEKIVFDTAPTGHTLRLLTLPEILENWVDQLIKKRQQAMKLMKMTATIDESLRSKIEHDPIIEIMNRRKEKLKFARKILGDKKSSCFLFMLDAERLSILETLKAISILENYSISIDAIIINRILPETNDPFFARRVAMQKQQISEIKSLFKDIIIGYVPLSDSEIQGIESLREIKFESIKFNQLR